MHSPHHIPLLSAEEEQALARQIEAGVLARHLLACGAWSVPATAEELAAVAAAGAAAWQHFLLANVRLVWKLAGREARLSGLPVAELFQEGFVALAGALQRYDAARGRFSTFATIRVRQHLAEVGSARFGEVGLPRGRALRLRRARGLEAVLGQQRGHVLDADELASVLDQPAEAIRRLLGHRSPVPIDTAADGAALAEPRPLDPDAAIYAGQLRRLLQRLDPDQARVVALRFGFLTGEPVDQQVVAQRLGLSLSTVRRLEKRALAVLRPLAGLLDQDGEHPLAG